MHASASPASTRWAGVILVASPKMLGALRPHEHLLTTAGLGVEELQRDLTNLTVAQLHDQLAALSVVEPRQRLSLGRR